jgi:transketolase
VHHVDGHDIDQIVSAGTKASSKPLAILCYTDPARGLPILNERYPVLHYLRFKSEQERNQYEAAYEEMTK